MSASAAKRPSGNGVPAVVLVVDDDPGNLLALRAVLEPLEEKIAEASSGEGALKYLLTHEAAAILLDAHLPGMSGFEVAQALRGRERTRDVPILFVTGTALDGATEGYAQGAFDYLVKPYDPDALRAKVAALLKLYRQRRAAEMERDAVVESERANRAETASERAAVHDLLSQAPALIARLRGPTHIFEFANARYIEAIGGRDPTGKTIGDALPELEGQPFYGILDQVYASGVAYAANEVRVLIARNAGEPPEEIFFNFVYQPTRDGDGAVGGILVHAVEVTEQVRARESVRASEQRFRLMAEAIPQQVWMARPDGAIEFVNSKVLEYSGRTFAEIMAEGWTGPVHPEDLPACVSAWTRAVETGAPFEVELRLRRAADGAYRWHLARALAARDEAGAIVRWYGTVTDIDDQKAAAVQLSRLAALQQEVLGIVGHDLRNPLNAILISTRTLANKAEDSLRPTITRVARSAVRMKNMINDLVNYTRGRLGDTASLERQRCKIADLLHEVIDELAAVNPERTIRFEPGDDGEGLWEPSRLQQMASNLIANALQYSPKETEVVVRIRREPGEVCIEVENRGKRIPPQAMTSIFEPFKRVEDSQGPGAGHLGLGLYIVQQVAHAHGGRVEVRSDDESGTRFVVHLPLAAAPVT